MLKKNLNIIKEEVGLMNDVLQEIFVKGNLSWGNIAVLAVILAGIWGMIFLKSKWTRAGQKTQERSSPIPLYL
ncbi:MAG: hypothetical protein D3909_17390 [Candidatus Electrothrix sp. ATG1]|nr:hypothetical protein [Candidatus Electrothrix sp. ATG1]